MALESTSTITVQCTLNTVYQIGLNKGLHGSDVGDRKMLRTGETELLGYGLYRDSVRTQNWGDVDLDRVTGTGGGHEPYCTA